MSGGVDSSVAALIMLRLGFSTAGVTMKLFSGESVAAIDAAGVCRSLDIPHFTADLSDAFKNAVIAPFCAAYEAGETPNPCSACNELVKFGIIIDLLEKEWGDNFDVATGHYAKIIRRDGEAFLAMAENKGKDQSYFLSGLRRELLPRLRFPLGELSGKEETRNIAREAGLPVAEKKDSMDICFAAEDDYRKILGNQGESGVIVDRSGKVLGRHGGLAGYTVGQRKGLGLSSPRPLFVVEIRTGDNTLVVAPREEAFIDVVCARAPNMLIPGEVGEGKTLRAKIRSQGEPQSCNVILLNKETLSVCFSEPVFAPAAGQRLVLYTSDDRVAAGGIITPRKT